MKKRFGFTLAEVLITLGIIGVVAAMTIPTLIQNTNSVKFQAQFKKSVSTLSQAALMAQAQYDLDYAGINASSTTAACGTDQLSQPATAGQYTMCGLFNSTLAGQTYLGTYGTVPGANAAGTYAISTKSSGFTLPTTTLIYGLADGSFVGFSADAKDCSVSPGTPLTAAVLTTGALKECVGFIDVNGANPPNEEVSCGGTGSSAVATAIGTNATACGLTAVGTKSADVYPIVFHNGTVEPATNAARAALSRAK